MYLMDEHTSAPAEAGRYDQVAAAPPGGYDLRVLLRATGGAWSAGASPAEARIEHKGEVELIDGGPCEVTSSPLSVAGYSDGIQAIRCIAWRGRRPINLSYCAAGALAARDRPVGLAERLFLCASVADHDWVRELPAGLAVLWVNETAPPEVAASLHDAVGGFRAHLEDTLTAELVADGVATSSSPLVVDGDLRSFERHRHGRAVVGVVKTHRTRWLPDETQLWDLAQGWRSARFKIPAGGGVGVDRYSCYVRLCGGENRPWSFGLIRCESTDLSQLDELCALTLTQRQGSDAPDGRWDRQLVLVRAVEEWLAARRPVALNPR